MAEYRNNGASPHSAERAGSNQPVDRAVKLSSSEVADDAAKYSSAQLANREEYYSRAEQVGSADKCISGKNGKAGEEENLSPDVAAIRAWLVAKLSALLEIEPDDLDVREPFASYGLGSTELVGLSGELAEWLGRELPAELAYECPTIETLARHLAEYGDVAKSPTMGEHSRDVSAEAIAIIGIGCRFPGADDAEAFWQLLRDGVDAIREVPAERFDVNDFFDADPTTPGKMNTRWGGFIEQVDQFDAHFFGISPREAARMDPQQRLLLEVSAQALEDAGLVRERLAGSPTGVFIGISNNDYGRIQLNDYRQIDAYAGTGNALSIAANRISYTFDFRGPSMALDTACSSSLVAVHGACSSLRGGECEVALAGGVNLILSPAITINFSKAGAMAPDGRCKTFDARADGYVRGEGAGIVVLKALSKAIADGDKIYAVIRGSAVNQDGRSNGLMAPNPRAQEAVLREAYRRAEVSSGEVQYIEAHGTGTLLGDPIEAKALGAILGIDRDPARPCAVGSVKTNIGHLEAAAGIAGLIKVALALKHREIPPSLNFETANPHIPFDQLPLQVQTTLGPWPKASVRLAGVSSFGFGGTNAHVVLQEAPQSNLGISRAERSTEYPEREICKTNSAYLLPLSARSPKALRDLALAYQDFLRRSDARASLHDICYSASMRRSHYEYRLALTGDSAEQLSENLGAYLREETPAGRSTGYRLPGSPRKIVLVFPGQGSQWFGMARRLLEQDGVFRAAMERCDRAMRSYGDWSLQAELAATETADSRLNEIDVLQPALFAIQVALAALWRSWGIEPDAVVGHSMGEVAAAHVAGALSLEDAARIICRRSEIVRRTIGQGAMAAVELSIEDARRALAGYEDRVSIAASNSPASTVLSGEPTALQAILDQLRRRGIFCRVVKVDFAAHSPQMDLLGGELLEALEGIDPRASTIPIYSTVTGSPNKQGKGGGGLDLDARYWVRNLRETVLFSTAIERLIEDGNDIFLEISPHPILLSSIQQGLNHLGRKGTVLPSLRREQDGRTVMNGSLGALYSVGHEVDWSRIYSGGGQCVGLPFYPWQREHCWLESADPDSDSHLEQNSPFGAGAGELPGRHFTSPLEAGTDVWEVSLDKREMVFLDNHRIEGAAVLPASFYLEMVLAAAIEVFGAQSFAMNDVEFHKALFMADGARQTMQVILSPSPDGRKFFHVYSCRGDAQQSGGAWILHAKGKVRPQVDDGIIEHSGRAELVEIQSRCQEQITGPDYYLRLRENGIDYGPFFQSITQLWRNDGEVLAEVCATDQSSPYINSYPIHPAILDAGLHVMGAAVPTATGGNANRDIYMPTHISQVRIDAYPGQRLWSHAHLQERDDDTDDTIEGEVRLLDETGRVVVEMLGTRFDRLGGEMMRAALENPDDWLYEFQWQIREWQDGQSGAKPLTESSPGDWLIFADRGGVGDALGALVSARGGRSILVTRGESYERTDGEHFRVHPERSEDMRQLCEALLTYGQPSRRVVVHLWSLDAERLSGETTVASLEAAQTLGCGNVLLLVQELARVERDYYPRIWLVTRGAQPAGEGTQPISIEQAPLWGLGRVIAQEHPMSWGGLIDLEPRVSSHDDTAGQLWREIAAPDGEDQLAFRDGRRYAGRLVRKRRGVAQRTSIGWRTDASYLITGGLGDLGLAVARWMVKQGAWRLILLGRTKLPPRSDWNTVEAGSRQSNQIVVIRELEALGASVHLASVDVADEGNLEAFLGEFCAEGWPPIRGVVHAAGVLQDGLLVQLDAAALNAVLRPKMIGGWLLHRLLAETPLDFFVLFSSAGALLGQPGQGNYASANAFLDALAHYRRAKGQSGLTINWGAWKGLGFAETPGGKRLAARLELQGIGSIAVERALEVMGRLIVQDSIQVAVVPVDWNRYREAHPAGTESRLLSELAREELEGSPQAHHPGDMRSMLLAAELTERRELLVSHLTQLVARVLGLSAFKVDIDQPLSNLGLDSLMAVELKNRIAVDLGVNVPMVTFLSGPSIEQATAQILQLLTSSETPLSSRPLIHAVENDDGKGQNGGGEEIRLENLDQYSDEQVNALLTNLLANEEISE